MGEGSIPLLATKLHAPRRRPTMSRPRLQLRLDPRDQPTLTLVSAGAGFGKTTLVAEWFADHPAMGWLSLDERDNDPAAFWAYFMAAVQMAAGGSGAAAATVLDQTQPSVDAALATLLNDLNAVSSDVVVVLDDYHVIDSIDIHQGLAYVVAHLPPHVHLVIASRSDPPLPLAAMRARGDLLEIRAADLRFTRDEIGALLSDGMGLSLAPGDVELLAARTEGWIAALKLAAISMQGRDDAGAFVEEFAGDDRFILDYLVGEVLDRQGPDVRSFLMETSILNRLSGPLCDAVTGRAGGRAMLEQLERANLFVVPLDDRRQWYRYHHLFADVLRARLLDEDPEHVADIHLRASNWYADNAEPAEAIDHAIAGGHLDQAARLIEITIPELRRSRQDATLRRWLEAMPDEVVRDRPVLAVNTIGARMVTGDASGVESLLALVEEAIAVTDTEPIVFDHDAFAQIPAQVLMYRAALALVIGDLDATVRHASDALALQTPDAYLLRGSATALIGIARWTSGDLEVAERLYREAISALIAADHLPDALGCSLALADIQLAMGQLGDATRTFDTALGWTAEHPGLRGAADMHVGLCEVLIEQNELDAAERHLEISEALGDVAGLPQHAYRWRVTKARLRRARGDLDGALDLLIAAAPFYDTDFSPPVRPVAALEARVRLARNELAAALRWVADRGLTSRDDLSYVREFEHITLCRVLIARHAEDHDEAALADALSLLDRLLAAATTGHRAGSSIEILVLLAAAHRARGAAAAAVAALQEGLRRSEGEGHIRVFLHAGPGVTALLRSVATAPDATPHAKRVLAAATGIDEPARRPAAAQQLVDPLSARELDVLRLLRSDLSGPEIASELIVSLNTVRTHTKRIYAKLGVNNRREAVRRAGELGL